MGIEITGGRNDAAPARGRGVLGVKVKSIGIGNAVGKVTNTVTGDVVIELFRLGQVLANEARRSPTRPNESRPSGLVPLAAFRSDYSIRKNGAEAFQ